MFTEAFTDSFTYEIECEEDIYDVMAGRTNYLDFSNYPPEHPNYNADNYLEPGYWKVRNVHSCCDVDIHLQDEGGSKVILEFVGLRAKMYSIKYLNGEEKKTAKGVLAGVRKGQLRHELYKEALFEEKKMTHAGHKIQKKDNQLFTVKMRKSSLCCLNDKIRVDRDGDSFICHSLGYNK